jgi:tetratricopeptide (TPR) repeat protein
MRALIVLIACVRVAAAAPSSGEAKAAFDRGVAAYSKGDFAGAAEALEQSYKAEADPDTLFAWAQSERKAGHCDKALKLYDRLLKFDLPDENKQAVRKNYEECKALLPPPPTTPPPATPVTTPVETPRPEAKREEPPPRNESRPWWRDPVGDALVGLGAVGVGVGVSFLVSARSADADAKASMNYFQFRSLEDKASSNSKIGIAASASGAVLITAGIVWYATHRGSDHPVTAWADGHGGGVAIAGGF